MPNDLDILRRVATEYRELCESPVNTERRRLWYLHNALQGERPMVLAEPGGVMKEWGPTVPALECTEEWARGQEWQLRARMHHFHDIADDATLEPTLNVRWKVNVSNYGVQEEKHIPQTDGGTLGAIHWDPPLKDLSRDFDKLTPQTYSVDREGTIAERDYLAGIYDGILDVRIRGPFWWTQGLTWAAIRLIGLEPLMLFMYDDPQGLHRLMGFLRDQHLAFSQWCEDEGLLTLNNENDYVGSGGLGYTRELPAPDFTGTVRMKDLWLLSESQETVGVGPELFEEFIFPYQLAIMEKYGLTYYGCCEPIHSRWHVLKRIPNLRTVSISPWCDEARMAAELGRRYVYARKPKPTLISTERFDESAIRADIRHTLDTARGCEIEFAMKDVHTLNGDPKRLGRWVRICREEIERGGRH